MKSSFVFVVLSALYVATILPACWGSSAPTGGSPGNLHSVSNFAGGEKPAVAGENAGNNRPSGTEPPVVVHSDDPPPTAPANGSHDAAASPNDGPSRGEGAEPVGDDAGTPPLERPRIDPRIADAFAAARKAKKAETAAVRIRLVRPASDGDIKIRIAISRVLAELREKGDLVAVAEKPEEALILATVAPAHIAILNASADVMRVEWVEPEGAIPAPSKVPSTREGAGKTPSGDGKLGDKLDSAPSKPEVPGSAKPNSEPPAAPTSPSGGGNSPSGGANKRGAGR